LLDYQVKRELYLAQGVPEYWIVNPDALVVSRWRGAGDKGEVLTKSIDWHPAGMPQPLSIDLAALFAEVL